MHARYELTERLISDQPSDDDPKAQAFARHSGVFDLRDAHADRVIVMTGATLSVMRRQQAIHNTRDVMDGLGIV